MAPIAVLATKLFAPARRSQLVARPRLIAQLDTTLRPDHRLTLVSAPAGFGKTTLLGEWLAHLGASRPEVRLAWVSLDDGDNDLPRLLAHLVAALQGAGLGGTAEVHYAVTFLLDHLPERLHLRGRAAYLMEQALPEMRRTRQDGLALAWMRSLPEPVARRSPVLGILSAWSLMRSGDLDGAEARIDQAERALAAGADDAGLAATWADTDDLRTVPATIAIYRASLAQARGDVAGTVRQARHALGLAGPGDHLVRGVRLLLAQRHDDQARSLLSRLHAAAAEAGRDGSLLEIRELRARLDRPGETAGTQPLADPLSPREHEVLRLLDGELTGPEIARRLFVSVNTLRTHTKRIFTKLDVTTRAAACSELPPGSHHVVTPGHPAAS